MDILVQGTSQCPVTMTGISFSIKSHPWVSDSILFCPFTDQQRLSQGTVADSRDRRRSASFFFQSSWHILHSHQQCEGSNFSTSLPTTGIGNLSNFRHFSGCIVTSCYGFILYFPNDVCIIFIGL